MIPDLDAIYHLFDRVVNVRSGYTVPLGLRGTVVGILPGERPRDIVYEVVFDEPFAAGLAIRCVRNHFSYIADIRVAYDH